MGGGHTHIYTHPRLTDLFELLWQNLPNILQIFDTRLTALFPSKHWAQYYVESLEKSKLIQMDMGKSLNTAGTEQLKAHLSKSDAVIIE